MGIPQPLPMRRERLRRITSTTADTNPFRYSGEYFDAESGNIYLRNRYYDASTGRFISEDSYWNPSNMIYGDNPDAERPSPNMDAIMQSVNLYVYCINNPVMFIDPLGLEYGKVRDFVNDYSEAFNGNVSIEQGTYAGMGCAIISMGDQERRIMYNGDVYTESRDGHGKLIGLSVSKVADNINGSLYMERTDFVQLMGLLGDSADTVTVESGWIFGAAVGIVVVAKAGSAIAGALGSGATATIAETIIGAERIGSALKGDAYHRAASYLSKAQLSLGKAFNWVNGDGEKFTLFQVEGGVNGKQGVFEYLINEAGQIVHQLFKVGSKITGRPN